MKKAALSMEMIIIIIATLAVLIIFLIFQRDKLFQIVEPLKGATEAVLA